MALTRENVGRLKDLIGGRPDRGIHPDEMSQSSGIKWKTGDTQNQGRRAYMPSINFNKRLQRNKRYFGFFFCHRCKLRWRSSHAYQRHYQKCSECGRKTYPNSLKVLDTKFRDYAPGEEETDGEVDQTHKGPHLQSSCQRCKKLGRPCMNEPRGRDSGVNILEAVDEDHDEQEGRHF